LAAKDGDELGAGLEEAAAFADGLEAAVELEGSGAAAVAEKPPVPCSCIALVDGRLQRPRLGFDGEVALKYWSATTVSAMRA
jgi:hypothetical protein